MTFGNGFKSAVDGLGLVIARCFAAGVLIVRLKYKLFFLVLYVSVLLVALPEFGGWREACEWKFAFNVFVAFRDFVVGGKSIAIGAVGAGNVENLTVAETLLHAMADGVVVVLGFDDGDRNTGFPLENVVGEFFLLFVS